MHMTVNSKSCDIELVVGLAYVVSNTVSQQSATFRLKGFTQYFKQTLNFTYTCFNDATRKKFPVGTFPKTSLRILA